MAISPGVSGSTSWVVHIEVLGLGSRILRPGSSFQTVPEKSGKERKSVLNNTKTFNFKFVLFSQIPQPLIYYVLTLSHTILVFLDETSEGMFLLYLLELAETAYLKVYGNYLVAWQSCCRYMYICMHNEKVNKLTKFLSFVQRYQSISVCHYQLILSFVFEISKLCCNDLFSSYQFITGKNIGWYRLLYFIVTLSSLICYFVEVKFRKNERYPKKFFNLIISQHQLLLNCFIRFKRLELLKDLHFRHHYFMGCSPRSKNLNVIKMFFKIGNL